MLLMLISMGDGSLSKELYDWFGYTPGTAAASAFAQQRNKLRSNEFVSSTMPTATVQGYRLFAVGGSEMRKDKTIQPCPPECLVRFNEQSAVTEG